MNVGIARFIISEPGRAALEALAADPLALAPNRELALQEKLRRSFSAEQAAALLEVAGARLRAKRQGKFSRAGQMFFTRSGLEQSSGEAVAEHRARRFSEAIGSAGSLSAVADLGCGVGCDSLALAARFAVTGVDLDEARLVFAEANAQVYDRVAHFQPLVADLKDLTGPVLAKKGWQALFFDPARRSSEGKRFFSVEQYQPPLSILRSWLPHLAEIGVKISPGVDYEQLAGYDCEVEIISEAGEVKEAVLWFGKLRTPGVQRRATLLPGGLTLTNWRPGEEQTIPCGAPLAYLYEPDGAVIRAGLVEELAGQLGDLQKLDPEIAYLTGARLIATPFARSFKIIESHPFNLKKLNRRLQELAVGRVVIKKRGSPLDPDQLAQALKLKGENVLTLVLTHIEGKHSVLFCEPAA